MNVCALCNSDVQIDKYFTRKSTCPKCGGDLHICLNCKFYSPTSHNKCLETKAEFQRNRDKANFCDYFVFKESVGSASSREKDDARKKLDELFE